MLIQSTYPVANDSLTNVASTSIKSSQTNKNAAFQQQLEACLQSSSTSSTNIDNKIPDAASSSIDAMLIAQNANKNNAELAVIKTSDWLDQKPEDYSMEKFQEKIAYANYTQSLLDTEVLPRWVTKPVPGLSCSTDMVAPPSFEEATGGVYRIDHTLSGKVVSYIPSYQWRKVSSAQGDAVLGDVYSQQTPWGFKTLSIRDGSGRTPADYTAGKYEQEIIAYLDSGSSQQANISSVNGPPAEMSWQERLVFYNNPARYLLAYLGYSQTSNDNSSRIG